MRLLSYLFVVFSLPTLAAGLPDTGQTSCFVSRALAACTSANSGDSSAYPRQDGRFGRDAAAAKGASSKIGGGAAGFDYTKVANDGSDLGATATLGSKTSDWACTRDNIPGLLWEVKVTAATAAQLRDQNGTYSWFNSNFGTNGGNVGTPDAGTCFNPGRCDTEKFVADVNAATLCGFADWRLPSKRELGTLVHVGSAAPMIDTSYFPNTFSEFFWSSTPYAEAVYGGAWRVSFSSGEINYTSQYNYPGRVRLVRGASF